MTEENGTPKRSDKPKFLPQHIEYLAARKLPLEYAKRAGIESFDVPSALVAKSLKRRFKNLAVYPSAGLLTPYLECPLDGIERARIRWDNSRYYNGTPGADEVAVEIPRYTAQEGVPVIPYYPPGVLVEGVQDNPAIDLYIVEAPMKALALTANGFRAIGLGGVEAGFQDVEQWKTSKHLEINRELDRIFWKGRIAYIVYDAGIINNPRVALGAAKLAAVLRDRGADVRLVILPLVHVQERTMEDVMLFDTDDQGPDDYLAQHGEAALRQLIDTAVPAGAVSRVRAIMNSDADNPTKRDRVAGLLQDLTFVAALHVGGRLVTESVAAEIRSTGIKLRALQEQVDRLLRRVDSHATENATDLPYKIDNGRIAMTTLVGGVATMKYLAEFDARISEEIVNDDGAQQSVMYSLEVTLADGTVLSPKQVPAAEFRKMEWPDGLGVKSIVRAGRDTRDHVRVAIQSLSKPTTATVYTHLGWREIGGKRVYLHPGGAIGAVDAAVRVSVAVERGSFGLPDRVENLTEAVRLSLSILDAGPIEITLPVVAATYTSVLAELLEIDFAVWLVGPSGSYKSTLAGKGQSHFGRFDYHSLPGNWNSTAGAIEALLFKLKDALVVIDNYVPGQTQRDQQALTGLALRVIQAIGDRSGRGRLDRNAEERATRRPRGLALMTAEDLPPTNESTLGRLIVVDVNKGALSLDNLAAIQDRAELLPHATRGFIEWLAPRLDGDGDRIRQLRKETAANYRVQLATANVHERTANSLAALAVGFGLFLDFARQVGAIDDERYDALHGAAEGALLAIGRKQRANVEGQKPTERYMSSLRALLLQGRVALAKPDQQLDYVSLASPQCRGIGWLDDQHVYLDPTLAWAAVEEFNTREGWSFKKTQLHKQLAEIGIIQREDDDDDAESRLTCRRTLGGGTKRVFVIARAHFEEAINDPQKTKQAAEQDEKSRREKLADNEVMVDDHDSDQLMN